MFLSSDISLHYLRSFGTPVTPYSVPISYPLPLSLRPISDLRPPYSVLRPIPLGPELRISVPRSSANRGHRRCLRALVNNFAEALTRVRRTPDRNPGTPDSARHSPNIAAERAFLGHPCYLTALLASYVFIIFHLEGRSPCTPCTVCDSWQSPGEKFTKNPFSIHLPETTSMT